MIFGITPFETISASAIVALVLLYLSSYLLRGVIGFGSATPTILGGVWIVPPHDAVILSILTSLAAQAILLPRGMRTCDRKILLPMLLGATLSIVLGTWIFATLSAEWLTLAIGAVLVFAVLAEQFKITERVIEGHDLRSFKIPFCLTSFTGILMASAVLAQTYYCRSMSVGQRQTQQRSAALTWPIPVWPSSGALPCLP